MARVSYMLVLLWRRGQVLWSAMCVRRCEKSHLVKKKSSRKKYLYYIHTVFVPKVFVDDYFPFNMIRAIRKKMQSKPCLLCIKQTEVSWQIPCSELGMWICSSNVIESATRTQMDYDSRRVVSTHFQLSRLRTIIFW